MSRFRRQLLFLCDAFLFAVAVAAYKFITVMLPYTATGAEENFWGNAALLYGCTVLAQLVFKTYDSLWRYAESREYLMLIASAFCGFAVYETIARLSGIGVISFVLLAAIAGAGRIFELLDEQPEADDGDGTLALVLGQL